MYGCWAWLRREWRVELALKKCPDRYGAPRIAAALHDEGITCSKNRIARRLRILGWQTTQTKKFQVTTASAPSNPVAPDLLEQDFRAKASNQKWTCDLTDAWTDEGWLDLAVARDLYSQAIVGWSMSRRMPQQLVSDVHSMALCRRGFPKNTIIHSGRDSRYCSHRYQQLIRSHRLQGSLGHKASGLDNAVMMSFVHTLKVELGHRERYGTRRLAQTRILKRNVL